MVETEQKISREESVVQRIVQRCNQKSETAFVAALKRADNPNMEYQAWEYLAQYRVNLEHEWERLPYVTVLAAVAKAKPTMDGFMELGQAIAACYEDGRTSDQAKGKLRRVLACDSTEELCVVLRPLLALIQSKGVRISYGKLLCDLVRFHNEWAEKIKARWAQGFFGAPVLEEDT